MAKNISNNQVNLSLYSKFTVPSSIPGVQRALQLARSSGQVTRGLKRLLHAAIIVNRGNCLFELLNRSTNHYSIIWITHTWNTELSFQSCLQCWGCNRHLNTVTNTWEVTQSRPTTHLTWFHILSHTLHPDKAERTSKEAQLLRRFYIYFHL